MMEKLGSWSIPVFEQVNENNHKIRITFEGFLCACSKDWIRFHVTKRIEDIMEALFEFAWKFCMVHSTAQANSLLNIDNSDI